MDKIVLAGQICWITFGVATVGACLLSSRSRPAMLIAWVVVGMVMLVGAALLNTAYLVAGNENAVFMDASWSPWVTETWRAVVPPTLCADRPAHLVRGSGGRADRQWRAPDAARASMCDRVPPRTLRVGWGVTLYTLAMLAGLVLLLGAERRAAGAETHPQQRPPVQVRS